MNLTLRGEGPGEKPGGMGAVAPWGLHGNRACNVTLGCSPVGCSQADEDGEDARCPESILKKKICKMFFSQEQQLLGRKIMI